MAGRIQYETAPDARRLPAIGPDRTSEAFHPSRNAGPLVRACTTVETHPFVTLSEGMCRSAPLPSVPHVMCRHAFHKWIPIECVLAAGVHEQTLHHGSHPEPAQGMHRALNCTFGFRIPTRCLEQVCTTTVSTEELLQTFDRGQKNTESLH